jgi:cytochrome P450
MQETPTRGYTIDVTETDEADWDHYAPEVLADQIAAYDRMRRQCPVAHDASGNWAVFKHADVVRVLDEYQTFSNVVSSHVAVPNGMDPPQHTAFRAIVDRYFTADRMKAFEPVVREIAAEMMAELPRGEDVEAMTILAQPYASRAQCGFMGWPETLHERMQQWTKENHAATHAQDREAMSAVASVFDGHIREQLEARRAAGADAPDDPTTELLSDQVDGRAITDAEIVSIVRNWTVGELGTIAASVGIILHYLATHPDVQQRLRADVSLIERATDEILRMHAPLVVNRRRTTRTAGLGARTIPAREPVMVVWASANRDEEVFGDPDVFDLNRDPRLNLLYGRGIHVCPGAPLARLELRVFVEQLFVDTADIGPAADACATNAVYPASGFATLPLRFA